MNKYLHCPCCGCAQKPWKLRKKFSCQDCGRALKSNIELVGLLSLAIFLVALEAADHIAGIYFARYGETGRLLLEAAAFVLVDIAGYFFLRIRPETDETGPE